MGSVESKYQDTPALIGSTAPSTVDNKALNQTMNTCMMMQMFRSTEYLCNITIKVADRIFSAHQTILACHSRAFKRLIQQEDKLNRQLFLKLNDIDPDTFQNLLDYVYTGKINIDVCNITAISMAAQKLEMDSVLKLCRNFIKQMNIEEAMAIIEIEPNPPCNKVFRSAINYILYNYQKVYKHELFDRLSVNKINFLLSHDSLVVEWEIQVLDGILKWIYYDVVNRSEHFQRLVKTVRFHVMSGTELKILPLMSRLTKDYYQNVLSNCPVIDSICKNGKLHRIAKCADCKPRKPEPHGISLEEKRTGMNMDHFLLNRGNSMYKIPSKPVLWCFTPEARTLIRGEPPDYQVIENAVTWTGHPDEKSVGDLEIKSNEDSSTRQSQCLEAYTDWLLKTCDDFPRLPNEIERSLSLQHLNRGDGTERIRMMSSVTLNSDGRIRSLFASSDNKNVSVLNKIFQTETSTAKETGTGDFAMQTEISVGEKLPLVPSISSNSDSNTIAKVERLLKDVNRICDRLSTVYGSESPRMVLSNENIIERDKDANITTIEKVETILLNVQRMQQRANELGSESTTSMLSDSDPVKTKDEIVVKVGMPLTSCSTSVSYPNTGIPLLINLPKSENCTELREKAERLLNDMEQIFDRLKNRPENEENVVTVKEETKAEPNVTPTPDAAVNESDSNVERPVKLGEGGEEKAEKTAERTKGGRKETEKTAERTKGGRKEAENIAERTKRGRKEAEKIAERTKRGRKEAENIAERTKGGRKEAEKITERTKGGRKEAEKTGKVRGGGREKAERTIELRGGGGEEAEEEIAELCGGGGEETEKAVKISGGGREKAERTVELRVGGGEEAEKIAELCGGGGEEAEKTVKISGGGREKAERAVELRVGGGEEAEKIAELCGGGGEEAEKTIKISGEGREKAERTVEIRVGGGEEAEEIAELCGGGGEETERTAELREGGGEEGGGCADHSDTVSLTICESGEESTRKKRRNHPVVSVYVTNSPKDTHHKIRWVTTKHRIHSDSEASDTESSNYTDEDDE
ncbi:uncharacterized protein LOC106876854 [Octopus bimaculoides]|nr:uncharacterized protein LOC106876854 [Octopus bimaculoides]|eukprot:XP_014781070.1 PREDICTED: uncharacterized protein LOC106876854 [Octopus bimaculoides]